MFNLNKISLGQINICLNQINFPSKKQIIAFVYGQKYNLFDLKPRINRTTWLSYTLIRSWEITFWIYKTPFWKFGKLLFNKNFEKNSKTYRQLLQLTTEICLIWTNFYFVQRYFVRVKQILFYSNKSFFE